MIDSGVSRSFLNQVSAYPASLCTTSQHFQRLRPCCYGKLTVTTTIEGDIKNTKSLDGIRGPTSQLPFGFVGEYRLVLTTGNNASSAAA